MKLRIDVDCTPTEARAFLGLPDVEPMQKAMMGEMEARLKKLVAEMGPETLLKTWGPSALKGFEEIQKAFWAGLSGAKKG
jgi:hypothetical protein